MHKFEINLQWQVTDGDEHTLDPALFKLLAAIKKQGSLKKAADQVNVSYRFAWGLLAKWQKIFGQALVLLEQGRGASLTILGEKLLQGNHQLVAQFSPDLNEYAAQFKREFSDLLSCYQNMALRLFASHDLLINQLRDTINKQINFRLDLHFHGSLEALRALQQGQCQIAGFHIPDGKLGLKLSPQYLEYLDQKKHRLIYVAQRNQGIIVAAKNPKKIHSIRSLKKTNIRFINRQADSGTRLLFDHLLEQYGINPNQISGFENEEFTHMAVAAMIASGAADAGFGIASIADQFGLEFIPQNKEHYCLAIPRNLEADPRIIQVIELLQSNAFKHSLNEYSAYETSRTGDEVSFAEIFNPKL